MPNIREYDSTAGLAPRTEGSTSLAYLANAQGNSGRAVGSLVAGGIEAAGDVALGFAEHKDLTRAAADYASVLSGLTKEWNETVATADPNDPEVANKFLSERVAAEIEAFKSKSFTEKGQAWVDNQSNSLTGRMTEMTTSDMSTLAGAAARQNLDQMINKLSVSVADDPSGLDAALQALNASTASFAASPNLTAAARASLKMTLNQAGAEALVKAAVSGAIMKNPEAGVALAKSAKYSKYISAADLKTFESAAKSVRDAKTADARAAETYRRQQEAYAFNAASNKVIEDYVSANENGDITVKPGAVQAALKLAGMPGAPPGSVRAAVGAITGMVEDAAKGRAATDDPDTLDDFRARIALPPDDPKALSVDNINEAKFNRLLSDKTYSTLRRTILDFKNDPEKRADQQALNTFFTAYKRTITASSLVNNDAIGDQYFGQFKAEVTSRFWAARAKGDKVSDLLKADGPFAKLVPTFIPPPGTGLKALTEQAKGAGVGIVPPVKLDGTTPAPVAPPAPAGKPTWKPGMTMEELNRALDGKK